MLIRIMFRGSYKSPIVRVTILKVGVAILSVGVAISKVGVAILKVGVALLPHHGETGLSYTFQL